TPVARLMRSLEATHFLPEGYLRGIDLILGNDEEAGAFQAGQWHVGGRPSFFPYAIWVKTHPSLFLLLGAAAVVGWRVQREGRRAAKPADKASSPAWSWYDLTPLFTLVVVYL